jgi:hypothetical protein
MQQLRTGLLVFTLALLPLLTPGQTYARSGCCSHHGGVSADGCGCNDGSPLSSTCRPYYTCTAGSGGAAAAEPVTLPTNVPTHVPTRIPTRVPTRIPTRALRFTPSSVPSRVTTKRPTPTPTKVVMTPKVSHVADTHPAGGFFNWLLRLLHGGK